MVVQLLLQCWTDSKNEPQERNRQNERVQYINRQVAVVIQLLLQLGRVMLYAHAIESKRQKRQATNIKNGTVHFATSFCTVMIRTSRSIALSYSPDRYQQPLKV